MAWRANRQWTDGVRMAVQPRLVAIAASQVAMTAAARRPAPAAAEHSRALASGQRPLWVRRCPRRRNPPPNRTARRESISRRWSARPRPVAADVADAAAAAVEAQGDSAVSSPGTPGAWLDREHMTASRALECRCTLGQYLLVDPVARMATSALNFYRHRSSTSVAKNTTSRGFGQLSLARLIQRQLRSASRLHRCGLHS